MGVQIPSRDDPTVARASTVLGGPIGRYARPGSGWWSPIRVLLAIATFTLVLGYGEKLPCANGQWVASKQYTHACYSDVIPLWTAEGLSSGAVPYRDHAVEYPVLTGGFMWVTAELTRGWHSIAEAGWLPGTDEGIMFGVLTCALLGICGLLVVLATAGAAGRNRVWDVAILAASPLLIFHAFSNWDLFAMAFTSGALWAWARNRPVLAGALIGLGTAAKLYPALLLIPLALLAYRCRQWRPVVAAGLAAAGCWLAVNLPVALAWTTGWKEFYTFSESRPAEASTFWAMLKHFYPSTFGKRERVRLDAARAGGGGGAADRAGRGRLPGADRADPSPAGPAGLPHGGRLPADHQGLEPAVLDLAGSAAGTGPAALADGVALAGLRDRGLGGHPALAAGRLRSEQGDDLRGTDLDTADPGRLPADPGRDDRAGDVPARAGSGAQRRVARPGAGLFASATDDRLLVLRPALVESE